MDAFLQLYEEAEAAHNAEDAAVAAARAANVFAKKWDKAFRGVIGKTTTCRRQVMLPKEMDAETEPFEPRSF